MEEYITVFDRRRGQFDDGRLGHLVKAGMKDYIMDLTGSEVRSPTTGGDIQSRHEV